MKGGEKVQIFGFFETQKLDFLRNKLSVEKTFLSQEAGMIRLSFDKKKFLIEATQVPILKIRGGVFFLPGTVALKSKNLNVTVTA